MAIFTLAAAQDNEDLIVQDNGELAVLYGYECALQSIREMIKTIIREYIFNGFAGLSYDAIVGTNFNTASFIAEADLIKMFDQNTDQTTKWCINWNQLLQLKINGNQIYADQDYALYNTKINNISFKTDRSNTLWATMSITFGGGKVANLDININEVANGLRSLKKIKEKPKGFQYQPLQDFLHLLIQAAPGVIIPPGNLIVLVSLPPPNFGVFQYTNFKKIICDNYYNNRILELPCDKNEFSIASNLHSEFFTIITPLSINITILDEPIVNNEQ
jgi:hypothetical protein